MLISDEGDNDVFFDSLHCLSPQESVLTGRDFGYEIWVKEPRGVKERRERFLQRMGLADTSSSSSSSSKVCSQEKMLSSGLEKIRDCGGAVSNACISPADQVPEKLVLSESKAISEAEFLFDELKGRPQYKPDESFRGEHGPGDGEGQEKFRDFDMVKMMKKNWWKRFVNSRKEVGGENFRSQLNAGTDKTRRIKVRQNKKRWMEFSALYVGQEIRAHKGLIWTMKFSPSGQYLASGGEDGVIRIWRVISLDTSSVCFAAEDSTVSNVKRDISCSSKKHRSQSLVVLPKKIFQIEETPLQEFYGHSGDVLDLSWSNSDILLSSSTDKTVRMWQIGCNQCLSVFRHNDFVTCVQFNPVDENYFVSGCIDGKVRIWGVREERVVDWADIRDVISAVSYRPDGKGFVVGSLTGTCRFYVASGKYFQLEAQIHVNGKKKTSGNKITGIQFSPKNHQRVVITSEDSKVRVLDGIELVQKCKGLPKSGSQMSGSFTSSGKHIISVGEDSRVYVWNFNHLRNGSSKQTKSECSCECFFSSGVTVAIPWSGMSAEGRGYCNNFAHCSSEMQQKLEAAPGVRDSERFSLSSWFSIDGTCRGSMTWPEEKLPSWDLPLAEDECDPLQLCLKDPWYETCVPETWGLSVVAAGCDGTIKTFHNFGLPVRL